MSHDAFVKGLRVIGLGTAAGAGVALVAKIWKSKKSNFEAGRKEDGTYYAKADLNECS